MLILPSYDILNYMGPKFYCRPILNFAQKIYQMIVFQIQSFDISGKNHSKDLSLYSLIADARVSFVSKSFMDTPNISSIRRFRNTRVL